MSQKSPTNVFVSKATREDFPAVLHLLKQYTKKMDISVDHFNKRDIALQARAEDGEIAGFVWGGLLANNSVMYIDKVVVNPKYTKQGVIPLLYKELFSRARRLGVKEGFGIIRKDEFHEKACMNALKLAFGADPIPYTYVMGKADQIMKDLEI